MEKKRKIKLILIVILILIGIYAFGKILLLNSVKLYIDYELGNNIYNVKRKKNNLDNYREQIRIDNEIESLLNQNYTLNNPLVIYNPYGSNKLSCNIYFTTQEEAYIEYTIHIDDDNITDYTNICYNEDKVSKMHKYQLIGFVPGCKNQLTIKAKDKDGNIVDSLKIEINIPDIEGNYIKKLNKTLLDNEQKLANGLYAMLGYNVGSSKEDKKWESNVEDIYLYDNNGIIRGIIPVKTGMPDRLEFYNEKMFYNYETDTIISINRLGKLEQKYEFENYSNHHDFILDEKNKNIIFLVNDDKDKSSVEDKILIADINEGNIKRVIDMKQILADLYSKLEYKQDWIHLNSVEVKDNDLLVSSKFLNSIICIENYNESPKLKYILGDSDFYKDIYNKDIVYSTKGDFNLHSSQHYLTVIDKDENSYYLTFFNNNSVNDSANLNNFNWKEKYVWANKQNSFYYKYLINEKEKTFELVESIAVPFSGIISNAEILENGNVQVSSGVVGWIGEFDTEGKLIQKLEYDIERYTYRVIKYNFKKFWF